MCDPLTIAGAAMTGGSILANMQANSAVAKKRDQTMAAETERQRGYSQEAAAINDTSQGRYKDFSSKQSDKSKNIGDYLAAQSKALPQDAPTDAAPASTNVLVQNEREKQLGKTADFGAQQNAALANMRSFGDMLGGISRDQATDAANLGTLGGFMRGSNAVLPMELEAANSAGGGWKTAGTALGLGGSIATSAGLGGGWDKLSGMFGGAPEVTNQTVNAAQASVLPRGVAPNQAYAARFTPLFG